KTDVEGSRSARRRSSVLIDHPDELVVDLGASNVRMSDGVVALALQHRHELRPRLEEAAALADGLESAVQLQRPRALTVAEETTMDALCGCVLLCAGVDDLRLDGVCCLEVLVGDAGVGDARIDERHPR